MNLQENITRILEIMGKNPSVELQNRTKKSFSEIKTKYKSFLDEADKIINPYEVIDKFENYLISKIPEIFPKMKTGKGGSNFSYECFQFLKTLVESEMKKMSSIKKFTIEKLGGGKEKIKSEMMNKDISDFIQMFSDIIDFGYHIAWMDEVEKYIDNITTFSKESNDWVWKNSKSIKKDIINIIVKNL